MSEAGIKNQVNWYWKPLLRCGAYEGKDWNEQRFYEWVASLPTRELRLLAATEVWT